MNQPKPLDTVIAMVKAINQGQLHSAVAKYETDACFVVHPGNVVKGTDAIAQAIGRMIDQKLVLSAQVEQTIQIDDLALYCSKWQLKGSSEDGSPIQYEGTSTDVLRRQADGSWLIAIDNPWGAAILG